MEAWYICYAQSADSLCAGDPRIICAICARATANRGGGPQHKRGSRSGCVVVERGFSLLSLSIVDHGTGRVRRPGNRGGCTHAS